MKTSTHNLYKALEYCECELFEKIPKWSIKKFQRDSPAWWCVDKKEWKLRKTRLVEIEVFIVKHNLDLIETVILMLYYYWDTGEHEYYKTALRFNTLNKLDKLRKIEVKEI